jgi:hypothetical protein
LFENGLFKKQPALKEARMRTVLRKSGFPGTALICAAVLTLSLLLGGCSQPDGGPPPAQYTITYVLNGGTNAGSNPAAYTAADLPLTLAAPTLAGYVFGLVRGCGL